MHADISPGISFDALLPRRIVFGWGRRVELTPRCAELGGRFFVVCGSRTLQSSPRWAELMDSLRAAGAVEECAMALREPTIGDVDQAAEVLRRVDPRPGDVVVGIGGGAAIDLAKALAALATNRHWSSVRDGLEGIGVGAQLTASPLPVVAIPTTAGTGSEATKNAVISCDDPPCKKSLRAEALAPQLALVDPELTVGVSPETTAHSGMDAIVQLIEAFLTRRATPFTDAICRQLLPGAVQSLEVAVRDGMNRTAREQMSAAALGSGVALANSGLGFAHGVAAALGALCEIPHGLACAVMLPAALQLNSEVRRDRLAQLDLDLAALPLTGEPAFTVPGDRLLAHVERLLSSLQIPRRLRDLGVRVEQIPALAQASLGNSMNGNPRSMSEREIAVVLESMW